MTANTPVWTVPAVVGSRVFIKDKTDVIAYDLSGQ